MTPHSSGAKRTAGYSVYAIGLFIALSGLANVIPTYNVLPRTGPFPVEWFRPLFYWLSILVFLAADAERRAGRGRLSPLHLGAYAVAAVVVSYVCYDYYRIGQIIANSVIFFGPREMYVALAAAALSLWACWILWGAPIAVLGGLALLYLATGQYWPGPLRTAPSDIYDTISANIWYDSDQGILGSIMGVVLTTVLPFIILGAILEGCGAGGSMIRISFHLMKKFKGGPAYAAILASALFGTVSGSAVANVVGTGVVTIPMIRKRGFNANFAGAVEATASTGGQILPPIMGEKSGLSYQSRRRRRANLPDIIVRPNGGYAFRRHTANARQSLDILDHNSAPSIVDKVLTAKRAHQFRDRDVSETEHVSDFFLSHG